MYTGSLKRHRYIVIKYERYYQYLSANQCAFASISRYLIQGHKDAADSRISDDSRDKWTSQPKYGGIEQKGARAQDGAMSHGSKRW